MRLLLLTSSYPRFAGDSAGLFVHDLAKRVADEGWQVTVLAPHAPGLQTVDHLEGVEIRRFAYAWPQALEQLSYGAGLLPNIRRRPYLLLLLLPYYLSMWRAARKIIREQSPDVVHAHWWFPAGLVAESLHRSFGTPYVVTVHGTDVHKLLRIGFMRRLAERVFRSSQAVTVNSLATRDALQRFIPDLPATYVIPAPVSLERCAAVIEELRGVSTSHCDETRRVVFVGRLIPQKGVLFLVQAFARLLELVSDCQLIIIGDGPQASACRDAAAKLKIETQVSFTGKLPHPEVLKQMSSADVVVMPSVTTRPGEIEGQGVVLIEALALGIPVIGTRNGGIVDIITHEQTGLCVDEGDVEGLAVAMRRVLDNPEWARQLAEEGARRVAAEFSSEAAGASLLQVLDLIVEQQLQKVRETIATSA